MKLLNTLQRVAKRARQSLADKQQRQFIERHATDLIHAPVGEDRYKAALYFADEMVNAYQIRQWYEPMKQLSDFMPIAVITRRPDTALALRDECPLPVYYAPTVEDLERLVDSQDLRLMLYVNQNIQNFQMLRFNEPKHVFICHGESEKSYMWSNQLKAYDFVFSAGQAARDRLTSQLHNFDVHERTRLIGRPQIDVSYVAPFSPNPALPTVLYAPTWEGDRPSMQYGSVVSHGEQLVDALISDCGFNLIFRPHPRSGKNSAAYGKAVERIRRKLAEANATSSAQLFFDDTTDWGWQWSTSDFCVTDISAVAYDFLATGKPMFVTRPASSEATVQDSPALARVPSLSADASENAPSLIRSALTESNMDLREVVEYYFGDVTAGASMRRFITESLKLVVGDVQAEQLPLKKAA